MTQCELVLRHLSTYKSITAYDAMRDYGIMRLASRISDLRNRGVEIRRVMESSKNRFGEPTCYARYILMEGKADGTNS